MLCRMQPKVILLTSFCAVVLMAGCSHIESHLNPNSAAPETKPASTSATPRTTPQAMKISVDDLKKLRWIEGTWRGTGVGQEAFFERYHFENPTTLVVETLADEKVEKVTDTGRFELKDGEFGNNEKGSRSVATALDDNSITFDPVFKARNTFKFQKESADSWKAILTWPATDKAPAGERVYNMERWARK
jgi:hypothetical protein